MEKLQITVGEASRWVKGAKKSRRFFRSVTKLLGTRTQLMKLLFSMAGHCWMEYLALAVLVSPSRRALPDAHGVPGWPWLLRRPGPESPHRSFLKLAKPVLQTGCPATPTVRRGGPDHARSW